MNLKTVLNSYWEVDVQVLESCVAMYRLQLQNLGSSFSLTIWLFYV